MFLVNQNIKTIFVKPVIISRQTQILLSASLLPFFTHNLILNCVLSHGLTAISDIALLLIFATKAIF